MLQQRVGTSDHVAEGSIVFFLQQPLHGGVHAGNLAASSDLLVVVEPILGLGHARDGKLAAPELFNIFRVLRRRHQLVMATADEVQQVAQELRYVRGTDKVLETKLANAATQKDPKVLLVENAEIFVRALQQAIAVIVKRGGVDAFAAEQVTNSLSHFRCGIPGVGEGDDFVRAGMGLLDQVGNPVRENGRLAGSRARNHEHGPLDMLYGLELAIVRYERQLSGVRLHEGHFPPSISSAPLEESGGESKNGFPDVGTGFLLRRYGSFPRAQLRSNEDEPDCLAEPNRCHAVNVEPQMPDSNPSNDEQRNDTAVDGDTAAESSVPQRGDRPKNDCHRGTHRINSREGLIDLENAVDHNLPLMRGGRNIPDHVLPNTRDDESADRGSDDHRHAREAEGDDCGEGDPVDGGQSPCEAAST